MDCKNCTKPQWFAGRRCNVCDLCSEANKSTRKGDWMGTYTGKRFWPLDPQPEDVCIKDIAHALSQICRFNGHTDAFYTLSHHSLNVAHYLKRTGCDELTQLYGLMHDAAEAYVCDIPKPLKKFLIGYKEIEDSVQQAILIHFGLKAPTENLNSSIKLADTYILSLEAKKFMRNTDNWDLPETKIGDELYYSIDMPVEKLWNIKAEWLLKKVS